MNVSHWTIKSSSGEAWSFLFAALIAARSGESTNHMLTAGDGSKGELVALPEPKLGSAMSDIASNVMPYMQFQVLIYTDSPSAHESSHALCAPGARVPCARRIMLACEPHQRNGDTASWLGGGRRGRSAQRVQHPPSRRVPMLAGTHIRTSSQGKKGHTGTQPHTVWHTRPSSKFHFFANRYAAAN